MTRVTFKVTLDGGIKIASGVTLTSAALAAVPVLAEGKRVYVRHTQNPSNCAEFVRTDAGVTMSVTWFGEPAKLVPQWANELHRILQHQ